MTRLMFALVLLFSSYCAFSCSCSISSSNERNVQKAYELSSKVLVGHVLKVNGDKAHVEVIESLKGNDLKDTVLLERTGSCSLYVQEGETWLLYLEPLDSVMYQTNQCLPNRLFKKMNMLSFPPPPKDSGMAEVPYLHSILLYQELISLRQKKLLDQEKERPVDRCSGYGFKWAMIIGLSVNIILLLFLFRRK